MSTATITATCTVELGEDWLDEQEFYEVCQSYRHARDAVPIAPGFPTAAQAFEDLKKYIREQIMLDRFTRDDG